MFNAEVNVTDVLLELISITHLEGERTSTNTAWNGESDGSHTQVEDTETGSSIEKSEIFNEDLMRDYKAREGAGDDGLMAAEVEVAVAKNQNENAREEESVDQPDRGRLRAAQVLADLGHLVRTDREWQHASGWTPNVTKLGRLDAVGYSGNSAGIAAVDPNKETPTATSGRTEPAFEIVPGYSNDTSVNVGSGSTLYATEKSYLEAGTGTRRLEKADVLGSARGSVSMGGGFVLGAKRGQDVLQTDVYLHPHTHPVSVQGASGVGDHTHGTVEGVRSKDGGKLDYQEYNGNTKRQVSIVWSDL
ncbi:hypothetical protein SARC_12102 [Sphaeroforma arctica JP610]|uniref:Uncharacterized protein n=1 Tax=Sphaeroforma arctica JP610 TaxID=667725 RepID=A0A0L0FF36_9EUKA|nr:hypothetical protein SARC_12102 [Sphaeroforma arctica JP610]KNC75370.1 hypothetical protein SARC_12102 [Sphaeroforma arctica JP610]|eukprot:XP_014149272.1 hypothetical protein SARC_12102 [Sphaeroforma arctica JP610]